jgi:hypothetical protein
MTPISGELDGALAAGPVGVGPAEVVFGLMEQVGKIVVVMEDARCCTDDCFGGRG